MYKVIKLLMLVSQAIFLQFMHGVGLAAFLIALAAGYYRVKSWWVPIMAVAMGVAVERFADIHDVTGLLEKAEKAEERGGFIILVYVVICIVGYIAGAYGRHYFLRFKGKAAAR